MSTSRGVVFFVIVAAAVMLALGTRGESAGAAAPTPVCGSVADCAQVAVLSAKTATDAELALGAKIDVMAAEVRTLKEELAKAQAALASMRTADGSDGSTHESGAGGAEVSTASCLPGQYVYALKANPLNPHHSDSAVGAVYLECRNVIPQPK